MDSGEFAALQEQAAEEIDHIGIFASVMKPEHIKEYVNNLHTGGHVHLDLVNPEMLDTLLLGCKSEDLENQLLIEHPKGKYWRDLYGDESLWLGQSGVWTPYLIIKEVLQKLDLTEDDVLYDLGAGYGRMMLYAAITTPATCKGIEIMEERVNVIQQAKDRLGLDNVTIIAGNILDQCYSDGNVFYLYSPFQYETYQKVVVQLKEIARLKRIRIVSLAGVPHRFGQEWLRQIDQIDVRGWPVRFYESNAWFRRPGPRRLAL